MLLANQRASRSILQNDWLVSGDAAFLRDRDCASLALDVLLLYLLVRHDVVNFRLQVLLYSPT